MDKIDIINAYIHDLLINSQTHEKHLDTLELVMQWLEENHMKINVGKCFLNNTEVSQLFGFQMYSKWN
jgi:hypothetical protein